MVIPRPSNPPEVQAGQATPTPPPRRATPSELTKSKYESRPTSGPVPSISSEAPEREEAVAEPAASSNEPTPTEVVFDLRESEHGFEATYWKREIDEPTVDRDAP